MAPKKKKKSVSLSVKRGEKLPASKGAGLTAKGRAKYNRATGSKLKARNQAAVSVKSRTVLVPPVK